MITKRIIPCLDVKDGRVVKGVNFQGLSDVSSLEDVLRLREMGLYGAIIGKAYYTGALDLKKAIEAAL